MKPKAQPISITVAPKNKKGLKTLFMSTKLEWFHLVDCLDLVDILAVTDQVH